MATEEAIGTTPPRLDDPDRALVELAARDGPLCPSCLAGRVERDRVDVLKRLSRLTSRGHLCQTDGGRYAVTDAAHAELRGHGTDA